MANYNENKKFSHEVGLEAKRKLKYQNENKRSVWIGFASFGIVGWSIVVPTLIGAAFGNWLDKKYPQSPSWTLTFLIVGLIIGCIIALNWIKKEHHGMHPDKKEQEKK